MITGYYWVLHPGGPEWIVALYDSRWNEWFIAGVEEGVPEKEGFWLSIGQKLNPPSK